MPFTQNGHRARNQPPQLVRQKPSELAAWLIWRRARLPHLRYHQLSREEEDWDAALFWIYINLPTVVHSFKIAKRSGSFSQIRCLVEFGSAEDLFNFTICYRGVIIEEWETLTEDTSVGDIYK